MPVPKKEAKMKPPAAQALFGARYKSLGLEE